MKRRLIDLWVLSVVGVIVWAAWHWFFVPWCGGLLLSSPSTACLPPLEVSHLLEWAVTLLGTSMFWVGAVLTVFWLREWCLGE
jgi:hypothetical protein